MAVAVLILVPLGLVTGIGDWVHRTMAAWATPADEPTIRIVVSTGDAVVKRGESVTVTAYPERSREGGPLPDALVLVVKTAGSTEETKRAMTRDDGDAFSITQASIADDFAYCVEAGTVRSPWYAVAVADPVSATDATTLTVEPPRYASELRRETRVGFGEVRSAQYSKVTFDLQFSRPAVEATLEFKPANTSLAERIALRVKPDRTAATAEFLIDRDGTFVLALTGDRGYRTEQTANVRITADLPPRFEKVIGLSAALRELRPNDAIPIDLAVIDDYRLAELAVEYCVNGNEAVIQTVDLPIRGVGTRRAEGTFRFDATGKVREGETLFLRLKARDNRTVTELRVEPQVVRFPAAGWAQFRIAALARPLDEQEILMQRDKVRGTLVAAAKLLEEAATEIAAVRADPDDGPLRPELNVRLRMAREKATEASKLIVDGLDEIGLSPDLHGLVGQLRELPDGHLFPIDADLRKATNEPTRSTRTPDLAAATDKLAKAMARLAVLRDRSDRMAQARLDRNGLQRLASGQAALAERCAKKADPDDELARKQRDLLHGLTTAISASESLTLATSLASGNELRALAEQSRKLADDWAALNRAATATDDLARRQRTAELSRRQNDLTAEAIRFAGTIEPAARVAGTAPLDPKALTQAAERLGSGPPLDALSEQEKAAREIDRIAEALGRATAQRGDPREAARQFSRWQDDLRRRYTDAVKTAPKGPLPVEARNDFAREQRALLSAVADLRHSGIDGLGLDAILADLGVASVELERSNDARAVVNAATENLAKLAERTPSNEQNIREAKGRLDSIRKEQDKLSGSADDIVRGVDPRNQPDAAHKAMAKALAEIAVKQDDLANRLRKLLVPGHETRQAVAVAASRRASADLRAALPLDTLVSLREVRRQIERLRQALEGVPPADVQAVEVARFQRAVAEAIAALPMPATEDRVAAIQQLQREVIKLLGGVTAPDAAGPLADARESMQVLEMGLKNREPKTALQPKARAAVANAQRLEARLAGEESDWSKIRRVAVERAELAERAGEAAKLPASTEGTLAAQRQVQKHLDELDTARVGLAQAAKKRATEALERLKQTNDPDRRVALQKTAAADLKALAEEMVRHDDRSTAPAPIGPPKATTADVLRNVTGNGHLPTQADADRAKELARQQRALRDATSEAGVDLAKGAKPAATDELAKLVDEQDALVREIRKLVAKLPVALHDRGNAAASATELAADSLRVGTVATALKAGEIAAERLTMIQREAGETASVVSDLAARQSKLNDRSKSLLGRPDAEAARQQHRQTELAADAARWRDALRDAQLRAEPASELLGKATEAAVVAHEKMSLPGRDPAVRTAAHDALDLARKAIAEAARSVPNVEPRPFGDLALGTAVRDAEGQMRQAISRLANPKESTTAAAAMKAASESLTRAAEAAGVPLRER